MLIAAKTVSFPAVYKVLQSSEVNWESAAETVIQLRKAITSYPDTAKLGHTLDNKIAEEDDSVKTDSKSVHQYELEASDHPKPHKLPRLENEAFEKKTAAHHEYKEEKTFRVSQRCKGGRINKRDLKVGAKKVQQAFKLTTSNVECEAAMGRIQNRKIKWEANGCSL